MWTRQAHRHQHGGFTTNECSSVDLRFGGALYILTNNIDCDLLGLWVNTHRTLSRVKTTPANLEKVGRLSCAGFQKATSRYGFTIWRAVVARTLPQWTPLTALWRVNIWSTACGITWHLCEMVLLRRAETIARSTSTDHGGSAFRAFQSTHEKKYRACLVYSCCWRHLVDALVCGYVFDAHQI